MGRLLKNVEGGGGEQNGRSVSYGSDPLVRHPAPPAHRMWGSKRWVLPTRVAVSHHNSHQKHGPHQHLATHGDASTGAPSEGTRVHSCSGYPEDETGSGTPSLCIGPS